MPPHREGGQAQYIEELVPRRASTSLAPLLDAVRASLGEDWPIAKMAAHSATSARSFQRRFVGAMGMPPGTYALGGEPAVVDSPGAPPHRLDGTLAGSALSLDQAVRNVVGLGIPTPTALLAATRVPASRPSFATAITRSFEPVISRASPASLGPTRSTL